MPHGQVGLDGANAITQALASAADLLANPVREMLGMTDVTVVADLPAGPSPALAALLPLITLMIVPLLAQPSALAQLPGIESGRFGGGMGRAGVGAADSGRVAYIVNQLDVRVPLGRAIADAAVLHLGIRLLGVVHRDEQVPEAAAAQRLVVESMPDTPAAQQIAAIARGVTSRLEQSTMASGPIAVAGGAR